MSAPQPFVNADRDPLEDPDFFNSHSTAPTSTSRTSLQKIFNLDNVDLRIFNMSRNTLPRISVFKLSSFRRMILQCSNPSKQIEDYSNVRIRPAADICYKRALWDSTPDIQTPRVITKPTLSNHPSLQQTPPQQNLRQSGPSLSTGSSGQSRTNTNAPAQLFRSPRPSSANDFAIHMKDNYPNLVYTEVGIVLKKHNAITFKMIYDARENVFTTTKKDTSVTFWAERNFLLSYI
ncbi:uncharacterized protein [Aegilops tauschii subsp. strangulata]|uniref:uncharacterized protein n=1 Tax=Aegilops tauschii subsp. strangulata TaxID=200361 RepID=UPI003CC878CD